MKTYLLATLGALLLLVPALAGAATLGQPNGQPQSTAGSFVSQPAPSFAGQGSVPVSASIPGSNPALRDSTMWLVNQTGGGR